MIISENKINRCNNPELRSVLQRMKQYEKYCNLFDGDLGTYVKTFERMKCVAPEGKMPEQLKEWLKIFDGGLLFTTSMFSTLDHKEGAFNQLLTFAEINSMDFKEKNDLPEEIVCFAMTNYGNYYCYVSYEDCGWVYEFDVDQCALTIKWDSFAQWLDEQIDFAESLIRDDLLDPLEV